MAADSALLKGLVGVPDSLGCPSVRRTADRVGELAHLGEGEALADGLGVEDLERRQLVAVLLDEGLPVSDGLHSANLGVTAEARLGDLIGRNGVDGLLITRPDFVNASAQLCVGG